MVGDCSRRTRSHTEEVTALFDKATAELPLDLVIRNNVHRYLVSSRSSVSSPRMTGSWIGRSTRPGWASFARQRDTISIFAKVVVRQMVIRATQPYE